MATIELYEDKGQAVIQAKGWLGNRFGAYRDAIEGAVYNGKVNVAPIDKVPAILRRLREAEFAVDLDDALKTALEKFTAQQWVDLQGAKDRIELFDAELRKTGRHMFGYQKYGSQWLAIKRGALLADEMGLGKTLQAIAAIPAKPRVVVVAPAVAKGVWQREVQFWRSHLRVRVLSGRGSFEWPEAGEMIVVNYDILPEVHTEECKKHKHKTEDGEDCKGCAPILDACPEDVTIIADEAHALKNGKAQRTVKFRALRRVAQLKNGRVWLLTATPLLNRPQELWSVYQAGGIAQEAFGTWKGFLQLFEGRPAHFGGYTWGTPKPEVVERIQRVCLRRRREEVMPELPRKRWSTVTVEADKKTLKTCDAALARYGSIDKLVKLLESNELKFEELSAVRAALATAKLPAMLKMVEDFEEQEEPLVVFSAHRAPIDALADRPGWAVITGDTSPEERTRIENDFQAGRLKGVGATIKAGGVAITLTRSAFALFVDREWTPALNAQAEDRICRIGQTRGCTIIGLSIEHALDERIVELLTNKSRLIEASVDAAREIQAPTQVQVEGLEFEDMIRAAEEEVKLADESLARKATPKSPRRSAASAQEKWAEQALRTLAGHDEDMASEENGVGFNKFDTSLGNNLAVQLTQGLTNKQWSVAIAICKKYRRQVGECPES